ncbi:MAG: hypothetical protein CL812_08650 [Confluentimicrobium sp.]|nr:hypothetical protein [Actibacterium sp.]|tara:strand:+ start:362 stop:703 length:342 start_codon:yes stop_codon:yes gene_type:complete
MNRSQFAVSERKHSNEYLRSDHIAECIDAWEIARRSYSAVLEAGVNRPDKELARDDAYRKLLLAGQKLHRLGGAETIGLISAHLGRSHQLASVEHFERLWCGLMPEMQEGVLH